MEEKLNKVSGSNLLRIQIGELTKEALDAGLHGIPYQVYNVAQRNLRKSIVQKFITIENNLVKLMRGQERTYIFLNNLLKKFTDGQEGVSEKDEMELMLNTDGSLFFTDFSYSEKIGIAIHLLTEKVSYVKKTFLDVYYIHKTVEFEGYRIGWSVPQNIKNFFHNFINKYIATNPSYATSEGYYLLKQISDEKNFDKAYYLYYNNLDLLFDFTFIKVNDGKEGTFFPVDLYCPFDSVENISENLYSPFHGGKVNFVSGMTTQRIYNISMTQRNMFWEKEPKVKNQRAAGYIYRKKGKIPLDVIDKMTERLNAYTIDDDLAKKRKRVVEELTRTSHEYNVAHLNDILRKMLKELADELPKDEPLWYASKEMKPYRAKIDTAVEWLVDLDEKTSKADCAFKQELQEKEQKLKGIMGNYYKERREKEIHFVQNMDGVTEIGDGLKILHTIEALEWDYRRRLGNIVLRKVREMQRETYKRNPRRKYKTNDKNLKRRLAISSRKVRGIMDGLFSSVAELFSPETKNYRNRLREIEEEIQEEHEKENRPQEQAKVNSKWDWGK